jgi:hypothetical protein
LAVHAFAWPHFDVPELVRSLLATATRLAGQLSADTAFVGGKTVIRWLSLHTGVPALVVAALLVCVGYRVLKRTVRFLLEVALVAGGLFAAWQLGWIAW